MSIKTLLCDIHRSFEEASSEWHSLLAELDAIRDEISREAFEEVFSTLDVRCFSDEARKREDVVEVRLEPSKKILPVVDDRWEDDDNEDDVGIVHVEATQPISMTPMPPRVVEDENEEEEPVTENAEPAEEGSEEGRDRIGSGKLDEDTVAAKVVEKLEYATEKKKSLETKLDSLIGLVKESLSEKQRPADSSVPSAMTHRIALEVVGRLKDSLPTLPATTDEESEATKTAPEPKIAFDDVELMIDRLSGNGF